MDFCIDSTLEAAPISEAPYRMTSTELKELKAQLEELLEKEYIKSIALHWGALILFMKKDRTLSGVK